MAPIATVAVFADRSTSGDAGLLGLLARLVPRRCNMLAGGGAGGGQVGRRVYQSIAGKLSLPDQQFGAPFRPTGFVQEEMAALSRQRTGLLEALPGLSAAVGKMARE